MFCKFCGNPVDRKTMKCISCGKPVGPLSGGNSFRELLQGGTREAAAPAEAPAASASQIARIASDVQELKKTISRKKSPAAVLPAACAVLCLISLISLFALSGRTRHAVEDLGIDTELRLEAIDRELKDIQSELSTRSETSAEPALPPEPSDISIAADPESRLNLVPGQTEPVFTCRASGDGLAFSWMKYSAEENEWSLIEPNDPNYRIISSNGESRLTVISAGMRHEGTYICVIRDMNGHVRYSAPAQLSLAAARDEINGDPAGEEEEGEADSGGFFLGGHL